MATETGWTPDQMEPELPPFLEVSGGSLADVDFLVFKHPKALSEESASRVLDQLRGWSEKEFGRRIPSLVLEEGASLEVVRSGGWVYCYERPAPPDGRYEVAYETHKGLSTVFAERVDGTWSPDLPWVEDETIYAWRPASVPPPVRRVAPEEPA